jgi:hypothetical protein
MGGTGGAGPAGETGPAGGFLSGTAAGDIRYWNGTQWIMLPVGQPGQFFILSSSNVPSWGGISYASLTTTAASNITETTATSGGNISSDGGSPVSARGVCWNTTGSPTIENSRTSDGAGTGSFTSALTGLTGSTTYFVRAYATTNVGIAYGNTISFNTGALASLTTIPGTNITATTASSGGNISNDGGAPVTARGICWNTTGSPTTADTKTTDGSGTGIFTSSLTGLMGSTTYYVRAYAITGNGTAYGDQVSFITSAPVLPTLTTTAVTNVTTMTASSGGNISSNGGALITARGVCWNKGGSPTIADSKTTDGAGSGSYPSSITGLTKLTTYYVRAYATNSAGTAYGDQVSFTTNRIGEFYGGGIIFYVYYDNGEHGLIAAPSDQGGEVEWHNGSDILTNATGNAVGAGAANTDLIVSVQGAGTYAAKLCYDLSLNGYTDWYLPSLTELSLLYQKKDVIGGFNSSYSYWSSTEHDSGTAWAVHFGGGSSPIYSKGYLTMRARAIRAF